jgi:hypothetical protein
MPIGILFWVIFVLWFVFGLYWTSNDFRAGNYGPLGGNIILLILLFLLGWRVFGFVIQG